MYDRGSSQALKGGARGVLVGSLIAFGWAIYGVSFMNQTARYVVLAIAAALTVGLIAAAASLLRRVRAMPEATSTQLAASRRAWRWFWVNLVAEIVLLNLAINLLRAPDLHKYWIPAISTVVGLHFWPMAYFFRTHSYWYVGAAMMIGATIAGYLVASRDAAAPAIACLEALANAVILWSALGANVVRGRPRRLDRSQV